MKKTDENGSVPEQKNNSNIVRVSLENNYMSDMRDVFNYGNCERICPEAPVPVFVPLHNTSNLGMAGDVYNNLLSLGNKCELITDKEFPKKERLVDIKSNQIITRIDYTKNKDKKFSFKGINFNNYSAVVVSDYDKGFLSREDLVKISNSHPLTFLDTKKKIDRWANNFSFIKINEVEYKASKDTVSHSNLIVTLSEKGAMYKGEIFPVKKVNITDISGAGDTFLAALVSEYIKSKNIKKAIKFANKCASIVVTKKGVSVI